jgi:hypothetical protein
MGRTLIDGVLESLCRPALGGAHSDGVTGVACQNALVLGSRAANRRSAASAPQQFLTAAASMLMRELRVRAVRTLCAPTQVTWSRD